MPADDREHPGGSLFAFFGSDPVSAADLGARREDRASLLALDVEAIAAAHAAGRSFTLPDDWVGAEAMRAVRERALACEHGWYEGAREGLTSSGICWPELDHHAMRWFWADAILADALAEAFRERGVETLRFPQRAMPRHLRYYEGPSDVCGAVWKHRLPGVAVPSMFGEAPHDGSDIEASAAGWYDSLRDGLRRFDRGLRRLTRRRRSGAKADTAPGRPASDPDLLRGRVVLAFNAHEFHRHSPIVAELKACYPDALGAVLLEDDAHRAAEIAARWDIPVLPGPAMEAVDADLGARFAASCKTLATTEADQPWGATLAAVPFQFDYFSRVRWPQLDALYRRWRAIWEQAQPHAVLVSSLQDAESQLPAEAAERLGVSSFAVPHGALQGDDLSTLRCGSILYSLPLQRRLLEMYGVEASRIVACRGLVQDHEYPAVAVPADAPPGSTRIVVLTNTIGLAGTAAATIRGRSQIEGLRAVVYPPEDLADRLVVRIKTHPHYTDEGLLAAAGAPVLDARLPPDADLHATLRETDLVVGLNYYGSALAHVIRIGVPTVFFWPDALIGSTPSRPHESLCSEAGPLARSADDLWAEVRSFLEDPGPLRAQMQAFAAQSAHEDDAPAMDAVIGRGPA